MKKNYLRLLIFPFVIFWSFSTPRGYEVTIAKGDASPMKVYTKSENVEELMQTINFEYDMLDVFSESVDTPIYDGMNLQIDDVEYKIETKTETIPFDTRTIKTNEVPLFTTKVLQEGISLGKTHYYRVQYVNGSSVGSEFLETVVSSNSQDKIIGIGTGNPGSFTGSMTGYGPDCKGCSGRLACVPYTVSSDKITYPDKSYGSVRIIAADRQVPCGTVMTISGAFGEKITAIVLDRGSAITGKKVDLLFPSESDTSSFGRKKNIKFDVLRWGW